MANCICDIPSGSSVMAAVAISVFASAVAISVRVPAAMNATAHGRITTTSTTATIPARRVYD